jgi:sialidase-1
MNELPMDSFGDAAFFLALTIGIPPRSASLPLVTEAPDRPTLLVFTEVRKFSDEDWGAKGIGMRRSFDLGRTWTSVVQVLTDAPQSGGKWNLTQEWNRSLYDGAGYDGVNLGAVTYDSHTGRVFVHYVLCGNPCATLGCVKPAFCPPDGSARMFYIASNSSFARWDPPVEITHMLPGLGMFSPGPGEGVQANSGRLIICGYSLRSDTTTGKLTGTSSLIVSDTHGETWSVGANLNDVTSHPSSECDAAMLRNGSVLVSFRSEMNSNISGAFRLQARSDDEGSTFVPDSFRVVHELPDPHCQASMIRHAGALYMSHTSSQQARQNMLLSVSHTEGDTWETQSTVWSSYAGYSSIAGISADVWGQDSIAIAYNRGWDGDSCVGDACPYDTFVSFALIPMDSSSPNNSMSATGYDHNTSPAAVTAEKTLDDDLSSSAYDILALGHWCLRSVNPPDAPNLFENVDLVVTALSPPNSTAGVNYTEIIFGQSEGFPQPLMNGSQLNSAYELIEFGRARWGADKFVFTEPVRGSRWLVVARDAKCFRDEQDGLRVHSDCGALMAQYAHSLCSALQRARLDWWIFDASATLMDPDTLQWFGPGAAQMLRYSKGVCARNYNTTLKLGWVTASSDTGHPVDTIIFQNWTTYSEQLAGHYSAHLGSMVSSIVDYVIVGQDHLGTSAAEQSCKTYFSSATGSFPGECSPGRDEKLMEWTRWSRSAIPRSKLIMGLPTRRTAVHSCPSSFRVGVELEQCMPNLGCSFSDGWMAGDSNSESGQFQLSAAASAGNMSVVYDVWSQQSYFVGTTSQGAPLNWIDSSMAKDYDFALRHLAWRGIAGFVAQCVDFDYTRRFGGRHWNQPVGVYQRFRASEVFVVSAGAAATAANGGQPTATGTDTGLDLASGDSICRMFGSRLASLADLRRAAIAGAEWAIYGLAQRFDQSGRLEGTVARPAGTGGGLTVSAGQAAQAVHCFGARPVGPASVWPFATAAFNRTHWSARSSQPPSSAPTQSLATTMIPGSGTALVYQITTKTLATLPPQGAAHTMELLATDETFRKEVPITPDAALVIAALLKATVATQPQIREAAMQNTSWGSGQLGLTVSETALKSWASMVGTAPTQNGVAINSMRVFDGGTVGLSAVNVYGPKPTMVERINGDPTNPFHVYLPFDKASSISPALKSDDSDVRASISLDSDWQFGLSTAVDTPF